MKILNVQQGSKEWIEARAKHFCASEAPAMMGASTYMSRTELLRQKATGDIPEIDAMKQALFDRGHAAEDAARAHLEAELEEELYPTTATDDDGFLLASYDGITMDGETGFEHKLWNEGLAAQVRAGELPPMYYWQLEQQILVAGLKRVHFVVSDGTPEKWEDLIYTPVPGRAEQLLAGWKQFAEDLKAYQPVEVIPAAVPTPVKALPAIVYRLNGLALSSNLVEFRIAAEQLVEDSKKALETDQDFSDRESLVKSFKEAEDKIALVQEQVVGEIKDVDAFCRDLGHISALIRQARLNGEKQIQARKDAIRLEILQKGQAAFAAHVLSLNMRLGKPYMPAIAIDFGGAMKGKRTIASLQDAVDTELARAKIEANSVADRIQINLSTLRELATEHSFLFHDTAQLVLKDNDDLTALVKMRIAEHKATQEKRIEEERERIRKEELVKIEAEQKKEAARIEAERVANEKKSAPQREASLIASPGNTDGHAAAADPSQPVPAAPMGVQQSKPAVTLVKGIIRPPDETIIAVLANHYRVPEATVISWIKEMAIFQKAVA